MVVTPLGWNVVGLDSNKVTVGPNQFPVGARVCNSTGVTTTLTASWNWLTANTYVNLAAGSAASVPSWSLADGACRDLYWTVEVTRSTAAYFTSRGFRIDLSDGTTTVSTPANRQIYVEKLVSQNRNVVSGITGPGISPDVTALYTGQTYQYTVRGATAPGGYEQLVFAAVFPPSLFEIVSVSTTYTADSSAIVPNPNDQVYADGCGWNNLTRACTGTGKVGGTMESVYTLRAIGSGSGSVLTEIYDFSGSSFHYNADFGASAPSVTVKQAVPDLAVVKTSSPATFASAGDVLTFTITATNTGNVPLTNVTITDPTAGTLALSPGGGRCVAATLAVNATLTCTGTYTTSSDDVIAGRVTNTATASGTDPGGSDVRKTATIDVPGPAPKAAIALVKTSSPSTFDSAGDVLTYTVTATNTGNLPLTGVVVTDSLALAGWACTPPGAAAAPGVSLAVGGVITCSGTYTTVTADVLAGKATNTARAIGVPPASTGLPAVDETTTIEVPGPKPVASLAVVKTADRTTFTAAGQPIAYAITATNTGNVPLTAVTVTDTKVASLDCSPATPVASLAPNATISCTGTYTTVAGDVTAGAVVNTATAAGKDPADATVTDTDSVRVVGPALTTDLSLTKSASPTSFASAGDTIAYTITATNTGTAPLTDVTVTDSKVAALSCSPTVPVTTLNPGGTIVCTGDYTTTPSDVSSGQVFNSAQVVGTDPSDAPVVRTASATVTGSGTASMSVAKSTTTTSFTSAGETIPFTVTVVNTGTSTLNGITVTDPLITSQAAPASPSFDCVWPGPTGQLQRAESAPCTGTYTVTPTDVTAGYVTNTASATNGTLTATGQVTVPGNPPAGDLRVVKTSSPSTFDSAGDVLTFTIVTTNTGSVPLTNVSVSDPGATGLALSPGGGSCAAATLAAGASFTCQATYTTTDTDVGNGSKANAATATGKDPSDNDVTDTGRVTVPGPTPAPALSVVKSSSPTTFDSAGDLLTFTIVTTNTGNVPLTAVNVSDPGVSGLALFPGGGSCAAATLAVNASFACQATYTTIDSDVLSGSKVNTATVTGKDPGDNTVTGSGEVTVPGPTPAPRLSVVKTSTPATFSAKDTDLLFRVVVTNTGNVPLTAVGVTDSLSSSITGWSCDPAASGVSLAVNASVTCTGTYRSTQADVDAGKVTNAASATGTPPTGSGITGTSTIDVPGPTPNPGLLLTKTADVPYFAGVGEVITYTLVAENTGNVTLTDVVLDDPLLAEPTCDPTGAGAVPGVTLAVGETATCTGTHVVTAEDLAYGGVQNTATATGTAPDESEVSSEDSVLVPSVTPRISIVKTASPTTYSTVNQLVTFTVVASNVGNVPLTNVAVADSWPALSLACEPAASGVSLGVLENITCTASYRTTSSDLTIGEITNSATATGAYAEIEVDDTSDVVVYREGNAPTPTPAPAPEPTSSAIPTPTPSVTPTASPSPAPTPAPAPPRLPQKSVGRLPVPKALKPFGTSVLLPATVMTNAGQPAKVRVDCTIPQQTRGLVPVLLEPKQPGGDIRLCLVKRGKDGKVSVTVLIPPPVKVTMTLSAPPKGKYGPYKKVISYTTRDKS